MKERLLFASKAKRDFAFTVLRFVFGSTTARRFTTGPQQIHPMYIEDRKDTPEGRDRGFGNNVYKTPFSQLYGLEWGIDPMRRPVSANDGF